MRIALAYAVSDLSLKEVAAWASALQLAEISGPGLLYRLRQAEDWLEQVLGQILSDQVPPAAGGFRLRVVDATVLNGPGQKAVQWRAQVSIHPSTGSMRAVELTADSGGEKFGRHPFRAHEVVLGDRGYATARGVYAVRQQESHMVVRFNPATLRTGAEKRRRIYLGEKEAEIPKVGPSNLKSKFRYPHHPHAATRAGTRPRQWLGFPPAPLQRARERERSRGCSPHCRANQCRLSASSDCTACAGRSNSYVSVCSRCCTWMRCPLEKDRPPKVGCGRG
jgi:hypothetical protein